MDQYDLTLAVLPDHELGRELERFQALKRLARHYGGDSGDWDSYIEAIEIEQLRRIEDGRVTPPF